MLTTALLVATAGGLSGPVTLGRAVRILRGPCMAFSLDERSIDPKPAGADDVHPLTRMLQGVHAGGVLGLVFAPQVMDGVVAAAWGAFGFLFVRRQTNKPSPVQFPLTPLAFYCVLARAGLALVDALPRRGVHDRCVRYVWRRRESGDLITFLGTGPQPCEYIA